MRSTLHVIIPSMPLAPAQTSHRGRVCAATGAVTRTDSSQAPLAVWRPLLHAPFITVGTTLL